MGLNLAEVVKHQPLHSSTVQSGAVMMAILHMEEQFRWKRDVRKHNGADVGGQQTKSSSKGL